MMELKSRTLLFAVTLALLYLIVPASSSLLECASGKTSACFRGSKIRKTYDGIDNYLKDYVPDQDPHVIMKLLEQWIQRESALKPTGNDALRLNALVQLHNLAPTDGPGRCNPSTSRILQDNDHALRGALSKLEFGQTPARYIDRLVNYYAKKFVIECDYEKVLEGFDEEALSYIKTIVGEYIGTRAKEELKFALMQGRVANPAKFVEQQPANAKSYAKTMKGIRPQRDASILYRSLSRVSYENRDPMSDYLKKVRKSATVEPGVDTQMVFKLYRKYIGKPCEGYVERVESSFGSNWARAQSRKLHKKQGTEEGFDKNLAYYYGCHVILLNEGALIDGLNEMVGQSDTF